MATAPGHVLHQGILAFRYPAAVRLSEVAAMIDAGFADVPDGERVAVLQDVRAVDPERLDPGAFASVGIYVAAFEARMTGRVAVVYGTDAQLALLEAIHRLVPEGTPGRPHLFGDMLQAITWLTNEGNVAAEAAARLLGEPPPD